MKGLELCEMYFHEVGFPAFEKQFGTLVERVAFGLVGDGSDCFGYDDELSRDHDWGPGFCIWMNREDINSAGRDIKKTYDSMPRNFAGFESRHESRWGTHRVGVMETGSFYRRFIGKSGPPESLREWLLIPDNALAAATNGKVFRDSLGEFTRIRETLLGYYPEDVRIKKIASSCMITGQAGQYNFSRCMKRSELYAACHSEIKFCFGALGLIFLLNRRYAPFYKWLHRAVKELPILGVSMYEKIRELMNTTDQDGKTEIIESISAAIISELSEQNLSDSDSNFLPDHGAHVEKRINDSEFREGNILTG